MLLSSNDLIAFLALDPTNPKHVSFISLATLLAPICDRLVKKYVGYEIEQAIFTDYHPLIATRPSLAQGFTEDDMILAYEGSPQGARPIRQGRGNSRDTLSTLNLPIRSITSIYDSFTAWLNPSLPNGDFPASTLLQPGSDYMVDWDSLDDSNVNWSRSGFIYRIGAVWSLQARTTKITYVAGYTPTELSNHYTEFKTAALLTGQYLFLQCVAIGRGTSFQNSGIVISEKMDDYEVKFQPRGKLPDVLMSDMPPGAKILLESYRRMSKFL